MGKFDGKLLVSDMEATLFNSQREVSEENYNAIKYFTSEGGKFSVASGRMIAAVGNFLDEIGINAPAILYNGAMLYSFETNTLLYEKTIEEERKSAIRKVYQTQPQFGLEIYSDEHIYILRECFETDRLRGKNYDVTFHMPDEVWDKPWTKALIIGDDEALDKFEPIYRKEYDDGYVTRSGKYYLDMVATGATKGYGVEKLAQMLGIKREDTYTVGDNMNDLEMIQYAGHGYAVANAVDALKKEAEAVVPSNDESAIAYIINNLIK